MTENFSQEENALRCDKPIEKQKKEQEFDRFENSEYVSELQKNWGATSLEKRYAAERLKRMGVIPYQGKKIGRVDEIFALVVQEASKTGKKQAINFHSGVINGMFVVPPLKEGDTVEEMFERYVKNQDRLRWDKPIEKQKAEEKAASNKLHGKQNN